MVVAVTTILSSEVLNIKINVQHWQLKYSVSTTSCGAYTFQYKPTLRDVEKDVHSNPAIVNMTSLSNNTLIFTIRLEHT